MEPFSLYSLRKEYESSVRAHYVGYASVSSYDIVLTMIPASLYEFPLGDLSIHNRVPKRRPDPRHHKMNEQHEQDAAERVDGVVMIRIERCPGDPRYMSGSKLHAKPRMIDENDHGPGDVQRWKSAELDRRLSVEIMKEWKSDESVESLKAGLVRQRTDEPTVDSVKHGRVHEPRRRRGKEQLNENGDEIDPSGAPYVAIDESSSIAMNRQIEEKQKG